MTKQNHPTRRHFLAAAVATTACGLAKPASPVPSHNTSDDALPAITDTHVYVGDWPHRELGGRNAADLPALLRRNQVTQAWVGCFDGLFHKDIAAVNERLAKFCTQQSETKLLPFGTVNPMLPDWEDDLCRCHEKFRMPGIRLHPGYHGYTLDDPRFAKLLLLATERRHIVQLVARLDEAPHKWLSPRFTQVELSPLVEILPTLPELRLLIFGGNVATYDKATSTIAGMNQVYCDFKGTVSGSKLTGRTLISRTVFASAVPLHPIASLLKQLQTERMDRVQRRAIAFETAARLIKV